MNAYVQYMTKIQLKLLVIKWVDQYKKREMIAVDAGLSSLLWTAKSVFVVSLGLDCKVCYIIWTAKSVLRFIFEAGRQMFLFLDS